MITLPEFELYIFDLDDTLINTRQAYYDAQETAIREVFPDLTGEDLTRHLQDLKWLCRLFGSGQPENYFTAFISNLRKSVSIPTSAVDNLQAVYDKEFRQNLSPSDGAIDYLQSLVDRGKNMALASNGKTATQLDKLHRTALAGYFPESSCFISEMVLPSQKKPSPHLIELACNSQGVSPNQSVFFGNMDSDIVAGNLAGVSTVFFGDRSVNDKDVPSIARPDHYFSNWL